MTTISILAKYLKVASQITLIFSRMSIFNHFFLCEYLAGSNGAHVSPPFAEKSFADTSDA